MFTYGPWILDFLQEQSVYPTGRKQNLTLHVYDFNLLIHSWREWDPSCSAFLFSLLGSVWKLLLRKNLTYACNCRVLLPAMKCSDASGQPHCKPEIRVILYRFTCKGWLFWRWLLFFFNRHLDLWNQFTQDLQGDAAHFTIHRTFTPHWSDEAIVVKSCLKTLVPWVGPETILWHCYAYPRNWTNRIQCI